MSAAQHYGAVDSVKTQTGLSADDLAGIDDEAALDDFIRVELAEASDEINRFCNRTFFEPVEHTEERFGNDSRTIQLRHYPVTNILSVETRSGDTLVEGEDFRIKSRRNFTNTEATENKGLLKRIDDRREFWREVEEYIFTYEAGYEQPPRVVDGVAEEMVIAGMREAIVSNQSTEKDGASSISMDGFSVTYNVPDALRAGNISETQYERLENLTQGGW